MAARGRSWAASLKEVAQLPNHHGGYHNRGIPVSCFIKMNRLALFTVPPAGSMFTNLALSYYIAAWGHFAAFFQVAFGELLQGEFMSRIREGRKKQKFPYKGKQKMKERSKLQQYSL